MNINGVSVSNTAALVYGVLCKLSATSAKNGKSYVYASRKRLGEYIERSERTAQRAVNELKNAGLISVQRMGLRGNDHIYIQNVVSRQDKNVVSEIKYISDNRDTSIYLAKVQEKRMEVAKLIESERQLAADQPRNSACTASKGKPTAKCPRTTKAMKLNARQKYKAMLEKKLSLTEDQRYKCYGERSEYIAANALADIIADAMSLERSKISVCGRLLSTSEYWDVVKHISAEGLIDLLCRIEEIRISRGVKNTRAYILASVYNDVRYKLLSKAV